MNQDFSYVMAKHTDEELVEIVTFYRDDYQPQAIKDAENELKSRNIGKEKIEEIKKKINKDEERKEEFENNKASKASRLINGIVDFFSFSIAAIILGGIIDLFVSNPSPETIEIISPLLFIFTAFYYYVFMEYRYQKTVGKFLTKTKVVMKDGTKPSLQKIFLRTFCRIFPLIQDRLSNTAVIKDTK